MRVSIVTPTLNIAQWLPQCLESVRSQQTEPGEVEHIVVDGGSEDESVEIARQHGAVVLEVAQPGIYSQINHGVEHATGEIVGYLGGDDILLPGALEIVKRWSRDGREPLLVGGIRWTEVDGRSRGDLAAPPTWMSSAMYASLGWNCMQHTSVFVRRDFMQDLGGFDESYVYNGDYEFFARALKHSSFDRSRASLSAWRMSGQVHSVEKQRGIDRETRRIQAAYAPSSGTRRAAYRLLLKVWLNGRSVRWFLKKRSGPAEARDSESNSPSED